MMYVVPLEKFIPLTTGFYSGGYLTPVRARATMSNHKKMHRRGGRLRSLLSRENGRG